MALVSSVAFRGTWQRQFLFTETRILPFTLYDGTTVKVPMMYQASEVKFGKETSSLFTTARVPASICFSLTWCH